MTTTAIITLAATTAPAASATSSTQTTGPAEVGPSDDSVHHHYALYFLIRLGEAQRKDRYAVGMI